MYLAFKFRIRRSCQTCLSYKHRLLKTKKERGLTVKVPRLSEASSNWLSTARLKGCDVNTRPALFSFFACDTHSNTGSLPLYMHAAVRESRRHSTARFRVCARRAVPAHSAVLCPQDRPVRGSAGRQLARASRTQRRSCTQHRDAGTGGGDNVTRFDSTLSSP